MDQSPFTLRSLLLRFVIVALPLLPCLNLFTHFDGDWVNHLWMIQYNGEYIKSNISSPAIYNTTTILGINTPLFYAQHFYSLAGLFSIIFGPDIGFRLIVFILLFGQLLHIERAFRYITSIPRLPLFVATLVTWAIYPLTNLYSRSALTEFVSSCLLNMAFSCLLVFAYELYHGRKSIYDYIGVGFLFTLAAVTHPLNALFGGMFFVVFGIALLFVLRQRWYYSFIIVNATFCILVLLPWAYSVKLFSKLLPVADAAVNAKNFRYIGFPYDVVSNLLSRLSPFPIEFRALIDGSKISTPHQDAQILLPLLIIVGVLYWCRCKDYLSLERLSSVPSTPFKVFLQPLIYASLFLFSVTFVVCIYPPASGVFGGIFDILQFCYRLINYINLSLIALAWLLLASLRSDDRMETLQKSILPYFMVACITMSASALYEKLVHAETLIYVRQFNEDEFPDQPELYAPIAYQANPSELPRTSYGHFAYIIKKHIPPVPDSVDLSKVVAADMQLDPRQFGKPMPLTLSLAAPAFVKTNVEPFLWNYIVLNGKTVDWNELYLTPFAYPPDEFGFVYGLNLPAGNHVLEYQFRPHFLWSLFQTISWQVTLGWLVCYLVVLFLQLRRFINRSHTLPDSSRY